MKALPETHRGYLIRPARPTGGKAGKGQNRTSTLQVLAVQPGYTTLLRAFRFTVGDDKSLRAAKEMARLFINHLE